MPKINKSKHSKKRQNFSLFDSSDKPSLSNSLNLLLDSETEVEQTPINVFKYSNQKYKNQHYHQLKSIDIDNYNEIISVNIYLQQIVMMINDYRQESVLSVLSLYMKRAAFD